MPDEIKIELTPEAEKILRHIQDMPQTMLVDIAKGMNRANVMLVSKIQEERLTGQGPFPVEEHKLGVRTGRLRPSLWSSDAQISGSAVESSIGTNVIYAGVHEFGFEGEVTVRPHSRKRFEVQTFSGVGKRRVQRKVRKEDRFVGAFKRKMNIPARAPITTGVEERLPALGAAVSAAIVEGFQKSGAA